jgi:hypothetical protein
MMPTPAEDAPSFAADQSLIDRFLAEDLYWQYWTGDVSTLLDIGDQETHWVLAVRKGRPTFETISRGHRHVTAAFGHARDARRFMIMQLGDSWRSDRRMPDIGPTEPAPGTILAPASPGYRLSWPGGEARISSDNDAVLFSWLATATPVDIARSFRHLNGEPLFDLGVRFDTRQQRPPGHATDPQPVETPPSEGIDTADLAVIDDVAARLGWARRPAEGTEVLALGDGQVGRALTYRRSQFVYESTVGADDRKAMATFATAAAARRFLVAELGGILRMQARLPIVRASRPAPGCTIEKEPTGLKVTFPAGWANFNLGAVGHQHALTFSWVADATLADIAASFQDPDGTPIFDPGRASQSTDRAGERWPDADEAEPPPRERDAHVVIAQDGDPTLHADLAVIDDFLAESLLWSRRPGQEPVILDIADFDAEWVLGHGEDGYVFEYRSQGRRTVYGTFSSARGPRRFAVMELGRLWRQSRAVRSVWQRVPAPGTQIHSSPSGHRLTWAGGEARFVMDYDAINFSWIAAAGLAEIAASYRHPDGEPLFGLGNPSQAPAG